MTRRELALEILRWEGGEVVDVNVLIRELVKVFRESEALWHVDTTI